MTVEIDEPIMLKQAPNLILDFIMTPVIDRVIKPDIPHGFCAVVVNGIYVADNSDVVVDPI